MTLSNQLKGWLLCATLGLLLIAISFDGAMSKFGVGLALLAVLVLGIPHGATDHILFRQINKDFEKGFLYRFLIRYLLLMGIFVLAWWIFPSLALTVFLAISAYHFGQSHWNQIEISIRYKAILYGLWGGSLLVGLLMINHAETLPIVNSILDREITIPTRYYSLIPALLLFINIGVIGLLFFGRKLSLISSIREIFTLLLFTIVFIQLPLLIGFAIYFVLWHSTLSIYDQINYFQTFKPDYNLKQFIVQSLPFTVLAFISIGGLSFFSPYETASVGWIGQFFILISIVTLPHSLLMDTILEKQNNSDTKPIDTHTTTQKHKSILIPQKVKSKIS